MGLLVVANLIYFVMIVYAVVMFVSKMRVLASLLFVAVVTNMVVFNFYKDTDAEWVTYVTLVASIVMLMSPLIAYVKYYKKKYTN